VGILVGEEGETMRLVTETGQVLDDETMLALYVFTAFYEQKTKKMAIPVYGSSGLEAIAAALDGRLIRTKANARSLLEVGEGEMNFLFDAQYAFIQILELLAKKNSTMSGLLEMLPDVQLLRELVPCPKDKKGQVMRKLMEDIKDNNVELLDGIKVFHPDGGWTLILPDSEHPVFTVYSQGMDEKKAKEFASDYINKIRQYQQV
jgi:mannose-1-phosphate guanylyltransferase/phosphomannomutase